MSSDLTLEQLIHLENPDYKNHRFKISVVTM